MVCRAAAAVYRRHGTNLNLREPVMTADPLAIRDGEAAIELPDKFDAGIYYIGRIRTPWTQPEECPKNPRESHAICTIEVDPRYAPALAGVESCSHVLVLYWMDRARRDLVLQVPRHYGEPRGTFALRSPARPNPIAASVAALRKIEGKVLTVASVSTASTERHSWTSSPILPQPTPFQRPLSAGMRDAQPRSDYEILQLPRRMSGVSATNCGRHAGRLGPPQLPGTGCADSMVLSLLRTWPCISSRSIGRRSFASRRPSSTIAS